MRLVFAALALVACSNAQPPPIGDSDGGPPPYSDDAFSPPIILDAGADAGPTEAFDFAGTCTSGVVAVWRFFDFQTHTPLDSSLHFSAQSADTEAALAGTTPVDLATVTGPDITTWTGVDVDSKLKAAGQQSRYMLRVTITTKPATDGTLPVLVHYRQSYDCAVGAQ
jgi:hypothetical protein